MARSKKYKDSLINSLKDPIEAAAYLNAAIDDGDPQIMLKSLRNIAEAQGGMTKLSKETELNRESLYRMLSEKGNPELNSFYSVIHALGFKISIQPDIQELA